MASPIRPCVSSLCCFLLLLIAACLPLQAFSQRIYTKEVRTYLGIGVPPAEPENDRERRRKEIGVFEGVISERIEKRFDYLIKNHLDLLRESVSRQDKDLKKMPYAEMTPDQRESLLI